MSNALGTSWLKYRFAYQKRFGEPVPDWVCVYDMYPRVSLTRTALKLGWKLPTNVLIRDEMHRGQWSVWG